MNVPAFVIEALKNQVGTRMSTWNGERRHPEQGAGGRPGLDGRSFPVFDNSPAIYGWVHGLGMFPVPAGTKGNCLPSLTGL